MAGTVEEYRKEQQRVWGAYVAVKPINIAGARAFNTGDPVPVSHVERGVVSREDVVGSNTKAAAEAAGTEKG